MGTSFSFIRKAAMTIRWNLWGLLLVTGSALGSEPARLEYSSATDFTEISITVKRTPDSSPDFIPVNVTLSPEARARTAAITLLAYNKQVSTYVDGYNVSDGATVMGVLNTREIQFSVPQDMLRKWMPWVQR